MKKSTFIMILSFFMAVLLAALPSLQIFAEDAQNAGEYISEVKIGVGKTADEAEKSLEGYIILQKDGKNADLNKDAGGGIGSKGVRVVYLGYKTTTNRKEAITDLAVMNMKGGYSVKDYEMLLEQQMTEQIIPFVNDFISAVNEYRTNYKSRLKENKARAKYVHDALNKLKDDDCGGAGLGDLLLNETKYEMGDEAYEALSEAEKKQHADILTIIAQANGKATLIMENLIIRAADPNEYTLIERFVALTYDDMLNMYDNMLPSDAEAELAKNYDDDARTLLATWSDLKARIDSYDDNLAEFEELSARDLSAEQSILDNYKSEGATDEEKEAYANAYAEISSVTQSKAALVADLALKDYLETYKYQGKTLADFFSTDYKSVENDPTVLYPLVAALSPGQRAGLEFVSLTDLLMIAATGSEGYEKLSDGMLEASIYEDVDREIYKAGGVALTNDALRAHAAEEIVGSESILSALTVCMIGVSASCFLGLGLFVAGQIKEEIRYTSDLNKIIKDAKKVAALDKTQRVDLLVNEELIETGLVKNHIARNAMMEKIAYGLPIAFVVFSAITLYCTYRDLVDYYNVDLSPIPRYIVDEKDITAYNAKGEKIVIKNQAAYYKVVETTRAESDEWYATLGTSGDLNGTVGRQWLALYAARNENEAPILASSLKVVVGSDDVPADYTTGIHMFGSDAAYNLNNTQLVWNNDAKSTYVYFGVEDASGAATSGSSFSAGYFILAGVIGLLAGAAITIGVTCGLKKKKNAAAK